MHTLPRPQAILILATLIFAALLAGCASDGDTPLPGDFLAPDPSAVAEEKVEPSKPKKKGFWSWENEKPNPPDWTMEIIDVQAEAAIQSEATTYVEAMMLARRQAGDDALRQLADRVAALYADDDKKQTVGSRLRADPETRQRIEQAIRDSVEILPHATTYESIFKITARLPLLPVASALLGEEIEPPESSPKEN